MVPYFPPTFPCSSRKQHRSRTRGDARVPRRFYRPPDPPFRARSPLTGGCSRARPSVAEAERETVAGQRTQGAPGRRVGAPSNSAVCPDRGAVPAAHPPSLTGHQLPRVTRRRGAPRLAGRQRGGPALIGRRRSRGAGGAVTPAVAEGLGLSGRWVPRAARRRRCARPGSGAERGAAAPNPPRAAPRAARPPPARPPGRRCAGVGRPRAGVYLRAGGRGGHRGRSPVPQRRRRRHPVASRGGCAGKRQRRLSPGRGSTPAGQAERRVRIPAPGAALGPGARSLRDVGAGPRASGA